MGAAIMAIGNFIAPALGFAAEGLAASIIGSAVVGAGIGGLTSAITGGDIMEGMLFGAVGGAVMGGVAYSIDPTLFTSAAVPTEVAGTTTEQALATAAASGKDLTNLQMTQALAAAQKEATLEAAKIASQGSLISGGVGMVGSMISGATESDAIAQQSEDNLEALRMQIESNEKIAAQTDETSRESLEVQREQIASTADTATANRLETARQFDQTLAETAESRARAAEALTGATVYQGPSQQAKADRQATITQGTEGYKGALSGYQREDTYTS